MPFPLAALIAPPLVKAAIGGLQTIFGNKREKDLVRPERTVSPAIQEGVARTRYQAQGENPEVQFMREQAQTNQAGAVAQIQKAGGTSSSTLAAALGAQKQAGRENLQAGQMGQQFKLDANMQYMRMLQELAQEQQMNFDWNQAQKYQEEANAARRLKESGMQNMMSGLTEGVGTMFGANSLFGQDQESSPYWNQKMGYMGTAEMYEAKQRMAMENFMKQMEPSKVQKTFLPQHGKFGQGINTTGYMNPWMPDLSKIQSLPGSN